MAYMWNLKKRYRSTYIQNKQTHRHRKQTYGYQSGKEAGRDKLGVWD